MALPVKKTKKGDPPDLHPKKSDPDYAEDIKENAAAKKGKGGGGSPTKSNLVTSNEVDGAIKAFAKKKQQMSSKARKRVANRLKAMKAGGK